jgi:hypothetical protein
MFVQSKFYKIVDKITKTSVIFRKERDFETEKYNFRFGYTFKEAFKSVNTKIEVDEEYLEKDKYVLQIQFGDNYAIWRY